MRQSKLYAYTDKSGKETVFRAFNKEDIKKYLNTTNYDVNKNCWEESSLNINTYYEGRIDRDLTEK